MHTYCQSYFIVSHTLLSGLLYWHVHFIGSPILFSNHSYLLCFGWYKINDFQVRAKKSTCSIFLGSGFGCRTSQTLYFSHMFLIWASQLGNFDFWCASNLYLPSHFLWHKTLITQTCKLYLFSQFSAEFAVIEMGNSFSQTNFFQLSPVFF